MYEQTAVPVNGARVVRQCRFAGVLRTIHRRSALFVPSSRVPRRVSSARRDDGPGYETKFSVRQPPGAAGSRSSDSFYTHKTVTKQLCDGAKTWHGWSSRFAADALRNWQRIRALADRNTFWFTRCFGPGCSTCMRRGAAAATTLLVRFDGKYAQRNLSKFVDDSFLGRFTSADKLDRFSQAFEVRR